jgi:predicted permease
MTFILLGLCLKKIPQFPDETGNVLNLFVIYISLPAVILLKIPELQISTNTLAPLLMPWLMLLLFCPAVLLISKIFRWSRAITGALLLLVPLGNTSFLGIPMVRAFFGESAIPYAVLYDQAGSFLALATYGSIIIAMYGSGSKPTVKSIFKKVLVFPPFIFLILALALRSVTYPAVASNILKMLASTLVPVVMIAVGYQLNLRINKKEVIPMGTGLFLKLAAMPVIALILCKAAGMSGVPAQVAVLEAGMSPMVSAGAMAILAGLAPSLTAAVVGFGMVLSFATLPLLYHLITLFI